MTEAQQDASGSSDDNDVLTLITEVSESMSRSMYPVSQTKHIVDEIDAAYGNQISTEIFATYMIALDRPTGQVAVANTGSTYRFDQIADTESLVSKLTKGAVPPAKAIKELRAIADTPPPMSLLLRVLGFMLQALGFALCFRMSLSATILAVVISAPIAVVLLWRSVPDMLASLMPFLLTFASALVIALWAVHSHLDDPVRLAVIPVVTLIPGAGLTIALIELTAGDMIAGASRLVFTLVILLSMAFGLALALDIVGLSADRLKDVTADLAPTWVLWIAAPIFAIGNILYACIPKRMWLWTIIFAFGTFWLTQVLQMTMNAAFAAGLAMGLCLLLAFIANTYAKSHPSVLVIFLPTFWLMVPGSMGFVAISGAITADRQLGDLGSSTALSLLSMAMCMMIASVLAPYVTRKPMHRK
ncbi:hypothetical protein GOHSU_14_01240 [Gordonia hirsuta DSM 44140 = NBRC 16056]|uniref:Threonine/serine exporter-like N-terminal domain-containing protein n=1 Tax=Gordonia hirsuta DSM 44140 = NBRC 16056 TaxID=1121927 RepID=L7LA91_9ACTN|nr:threonine/serine exporter family protein [Gordonia hirsuta]GAC56957.1 hypothetical protein GOHSU_14_01240 [Gordonia hirsuta DSM 44140 = NBRC 16056]